MQFACHRAAVLYTMQIAKWASIAVLVALLTIRTSALTCQQLADSTDGCEFYTDCLEVASPCGSSGYALAYGKKYCLRFGEQRHRFNAAVSAREA